MSRPISSEILGALLPYAAALTANNPERIIAAHHEDVVVHYFGNNPFAGTVRGKSAFLEVLKGIRKKANRSIVSVLDVLAGTNFGVIITLERWERDGMIAEMERLFRYRVKDGKILECWVCDPDQATVDRYLS